METILLKLYKVTWKHTANSYVVCKECDQEKVMRELEREDGRCDLLAYGIAFNRKRCRVICERI